MRPSAGSPFQQARALCERFSARWLRHLNGKNWPASAGRKGRKGIATLLGADLAVDPDAGALADVRLDASGVLGIVREEDALQRAALLAREVAANAREHVVASRV